MMPLEPIDFGVDTGAESEHKLFVLDVTPAQWEAIRRSDLALTGRMDAKTARDPEQA